MSSTFLYYPMDHYSVPFLLICNSEKPGSHHHGGGASMYLIVQVQYTCTEVSELLTYRPMAYNFIS